MEVSESLVQALAPDQPSINAAKKLLNPAEWPVLSQSENVNTIWGECQGSGSKPYYTMADVADNGYKCTCPSRKFPCKHVLALFWLFSDVPGNFTKTDPPEWVNDWLGRRKRTNTGEKTTSTDDSNKPVNKLNTQSTPTEQALTPEEIAKREADKAKRASQNKAKTQDSIKQGLIEFQQWVNDQLSHGIVHFLKEDTTKCRKIAARLVDAKAVNLAARIDELPAKISVFPVQQQPNFVLQEFAKLILLSEAWLANPDDIDTFRSVASSENREQLLAPTSDMPKPIVKNGTWQIIGEKSEMLRNGLQVSMRWLLLVADSSSSLSAAPTFALLLDYSTVKSGKNKTTSVIGMQIEGSVIFYPSRSPLRAILGEHKYITDTPVSQPTNNTHWREHFLAIHAKMPWIDDVPYIAQAGRISEDNTGQYWWHNKDKTQCLPLINNAINPIILGSQLSSVFVLLNGQFAELISAKTEHWGVITCL